MADLITPTELSSYLQTTVDTAPAELLITLLTGMVEEVAGVVLADETTIPSRVRAAALTAAARAYANPQGFTSVTIDDFTYRREGGAAALGLYFTAEEIASILAAYPPETGAGGAFSISPAFSTLPWKRESLWPTT